MTDFDPIYLGDGGIVFSSTRKPKYNMCSQDIGANLFRMDSDGANILQITKNTLVDNQSALLPDGRILYSRWEYVDRNFGDAHGLWTVNPDGAGQSIVYKNNTASPGAVYFGKPIAGTDKFACILSTHHGHMWGGAGRHRTVASGGRQTGGPANLALRTSSPASDPRTGSTATSSAA